MQILIVDENFEKIDHNFIFDENVLCLFDRFFTENFIFDQNFVFFWVNF